MHNRPTLMTTRRQTLGIGAGLVSVLAIGAAGATPAEMDVAIRALTGEAEVKPGRVTLDISPLVENGNAVPVTVTVDSPMTGTDYVRAIALFTERNPQPNVAVFRLGPRAGRARVATRMRLATSQKVTAVAELSDGSFWSANAEVIVTLAACVEG